MPFCQRKYNSTHAADAPLLFAIHPPDTAQILWWEWMKMLCSFPRTSLVSFRCLPQKLAHKKQVLRMEIISTMQFERLLLISERRTFNYDHFPLIKKKKNLQTSTHPKKQTNMWQKWRWEWGSNVTGREVCISKHFVVTQKHTLLAQISKLMSLKIQHFTFNEIEAL